MKWLAALLLLCACDKSTPLNHFSGQAFNIPYHIQIGHKLLDSDKEQICQIIQNVFTQIDTRFNHWNLTSEISKFNQCQANTPFKASSELLLLLDLSKTVSTLTQNRFDPTLGTLTTALKTENPLTGPAGIQHLHIEGNLLTKTADIKLDLDGISKGYAIDLLIEKISALKHKNIYVEWGGEIRATGLHPTKRPWRALLCGQEKVQIELDACAIATSGDGVQHFGTYTHIIDAKTQKPLPILNRSITVKAKTASLADALATALMQCTNEEIKELKKSLPCIEVWNEDGIL